MINLDKLHAEAKKQFLENNPWYKDVSFSHYDEEEEIFTRIYALRPDGSLNVMYDTSFPKMTDQSFAKESDINNIIHAYSKTGVLNMRQDGEFIDNTQVITDPIIASNIIRKAHDAFLQLPLQIRNLIGNNPAKLEDFISDDNNRDLCLKYGLITPKKEPAPDPLQMGLKELGDRIEKAVKPAKKEEK